MTSTVVTGAFHPHQLFARSNAQYDCNHLWQASSKPVAIAVVYGPFGCAAVFYVAAKPPTCC